MNDPKDFYKKIGDRAVELQKDKKSHAVLKIVPMHLGSYHGEPYEEMRAVSKTLIGLGFKRSMLLEDLNIADKFEHNRQDIYITTCKSLWDAGFIVIPLFYFPKISEEKSENGLGHHAELIETSAYSPPLLDKCAIFKHPDAKVVDHVNIIHPTRKISVNNFIEYQTKVVEYVKGYVPQVEQIIKIAEMANLSQQNLLTSKIPLPQKEGNGESKNV